MRRLFIQGGLWWSGGSGIDFVCVMLTYANVGGRD